MARGVFGEVRACNLTTGEGHTFFVAEDGWVLDVRHKGVVTLADVGCAD